MPLDNSVSMSIIAVKHVLLYGTDFIMCPIPCAKSVCARNIVSGSELGMEHGGTPGHTSVGHPFSNGYLILS